MTRLRYSHKQREEALKLLERGMHFADVAEKTGLTSRQLDSIRDSAGLREIRTLERDLEMTRLYDDGDSIKEIASAYGVSDHCAREVIKRIKRGGYGGYPKDPGFAFWAEVDDPAKNPRSTFKQTPKPVSKRTDAELIMKYQGDLISLQNKYDGLLETYRKMESRYSDEIAALGRLLAALEMKHAEELEAAQ